MVHIWDMLEQKIYNESRLNPHRLLQFLKRLVRDSDYLLAKGLSKLADINKLQKVLDTSVTEVPELIQKRWAAKVLLPKKEEEATVYVSLGAQFLSLIRKFTVIVPDMFAKSPVATLASRMLNATQYTLTGPEARNLKVKDRSTYGFDPRELLTLLVDVYRNLSRQQKFVLSCARDRTRYPSNLFANTCVLLQKHHFGDVVALEEFVNILQKACVKSEQSGSFEAEIDPTEDDFIKINLHKFALELLHRNDLAGSIRDLSTAVVALESALKSCPTGNPNRPNILGDLNVALMRRYERTGSNEDLNAAVEALREAFKLTTDTAWDQDDTSLIRSLLNMGGTLLRIFESRGRFPDLNESVQTLQEAARCARNGSDLKLGASTLSFLGGALEKRFEANGSMDDLEHAIEAMEEARILEPDDSPLSQARGLVNLGGLLRVRFEQKGRIEDINSSIELLRAGNRLIAKDYHRLPEFLSTLGRALQARFDQTGSIEDLDAAIETWREVVNSTPMESPNRADYLLVLGTVLELSFTKTGSKTTLDAANQAIEDAKKLMPPDPLDRARFLRDLGTTLLKRFKTTGSTNDINASVKSFETAMQCTPEDHAERAKSLTLFANALRLRCARTGNQDDLNTAVEVTKGLVRDNPEEELCLSNLAGVLMERAVRTGSTEDLAHAAGVSIKAIGLTPEDDPGRAYRLNNFACILVEQFRETTLMKYFNKATEALNESFMLTAELGNTEARSSTLLLQGRVLFYKFVNTQLDADLYAAITTLRECVQLTPKNHAARPDRLQLLGTAISKLPEVNQSAENLSEVMNFFEEAISATPEDHPTRSVFLVDLGYTFQTRFKLTGDKSDKHNAIERFEKAFHILSGSPHIRVQSAYSAAQLVASSDPIRATKFLRLAVELLPAVSPRTLTFHDQQKPLAGFSGLGNLAATMSLCSGDKAGVALQLLESSRGIMASLQLDTRTDITLLEKEHPHLALKFNQLRDAIDSSNRIIGSYTSLRDCRLYTKATQFDSVVKEIRKLPHFERFALASSPEDMIKLAQPGPIVVINVSKLGSNAFLVTNLDVQALPLPDLRYEELETKGEAFVKALKGLSLKNYGVANATVRSVTEWLWDVAVGPVLEELGFKETPRDNLPWPHVWWVVSGWLNQLPIHAAGYHKNGSSRNALDRVISSYTPTIKALAYARSNLSKPSSGLCREALLVSMPKTPNQRSLPHVAVEIERVNGSIPKSIPRSILETPTKDEVRFRLPFCDIAHFACHGQAHPKNPALSELLLQDWETDGFSVGDIVEMRLQAPRLAYLSACHAASNSSSILFDEGIHIAGAFQLAGFSNVIGTLWQVSDYHSVSIAEGIYKSMFDGTDKMNVGNAAGGLHSAVRRLREESEGFGSSRTLRDDVLLWAPFIHMGA